MLKDQGKKRAAFAWFFKLANRISKTPGVLFATYVLLALVAAVTPAHADYLNLGSPGYSECGNVSINGAVDTNPFGLVWDWGDGSKTTSMFPASHRYAANGTFTVTVTAPACNTLTRTTTVQITNAGGSGCSSVGARPFYNLKPYNIHLNVGQTSGVPLHVVDQDGNPASGTPSFTINNPPNPALVSISSSGYVTALRAEDTASEIGVWVEAALTGGPSVSNSSVVRVLPQGYTIPGFAEVIGEKTALYYPTAINGEDIAALVTQFQIPTVNEYAYQIENRLMATNPFSGGRQIFEVDFGITEENRVCGISGNPIRLGWNLAGNEWQNCFLVPFPVWAPPPSRSPQWGVFYHEVGHNMTWASSVFATGLGHYFYSEGLATAMGMSAMKEILENPGKYPIQSSASLSLQWIYDRDATGFSNDRLDWLNGGAPFSAMTPNIVDGIWLYHETGVPHFADRFFLPLQPLNIAELGPVLCSVKTGGDNGQHTFFAALTSAAAGTDLYNTFLNDYHYPLNQGLYDSAYAAFNGIIAQRECPGDFDRDGDTDGSDLAELIAGSYSLDIATFAQKFGRNNCL
jgi:PKD repeat protein